MTATVDMNKVMELASAPKTAEEVWAGCMASDGIMEYVKPIAYKDLANADEHTKVFAFYKHAKFEFNSVNELTLAFDEVKRAINNLLVINNKPNVSISDLIEGFGFAVYNEETLAMLALDKENEPLEDDEDDEDEDSHSFVGVNEAADSGDDLSLLETEGADSSLSSRYILEVGVTSYKVKYDSGIRLFIACRDYVEAKFNFENEAADINVKQTVDYIYEI